MKNGYFSASIVILMAVAGEGCHSSRQMSSVHTFLPNQVIAHRGAWKKNNFPQNSIASLREAIRIGCAGSEFDVHLTADDSLVICHDDDFQGLTIEKSRFDDLRAKPLPNGERIPTLYEYLSEGLKQNKTRLVLEVKKSIISKERTLALTAKCVEEVQKLKAQPWIVYISFDYDACKKIRQLDSRANVEYLNGDIAPAQLKSDNITGLDYQVKVFREHPEWIAEARALHLDLNAWTVNADKDLQYFLDQKFDYITTNEPERLFELISSRK